MTRSVDATLHAALQAGQGKIIATGYIGYSDGSVKYNAPVSAFKLTGTTLEFTMPYIGDFGSNQTHMWLKRGLTIAGVDYTITTGRFAIHNQQYLPNKTQVVTGGLFPNSYYQADGYQTYDTVINAFCTAFGKTAVYREPGEAWHGYKFLGVGKNVLLNNAMLMLNVLQQKRLIQMCDLGAEQVLVFCTDVYGSTNLSITLKDAFKIDHSSLRNRQFVWKDEVDTYHQAGTLTDPIHNLGYMESTDSPPARHASTHQLQAILRPDLRILDGDRVSFTAWGTTTSSLFARVREEFDAASRDVPQWRTIVEANTCFNNTEAGQTTTNIERTANFIPVSTSEFAINLSDKDTNLQHALNTLDNHGKAHGPITWHTVNTFYNSWDNYGGSEPVAQYGLDGLGRLWFKGTIKSGTAGVKAFTLLTAYRPSEKKTLLALSSAGVSFFDIETNGEVKPNASAPSYFVLMGQTPLT
jgi:hypothetical protein